MNQFITALISNLPPWLANKFKNADRELFSGSIIFFLTKIIGVGLTYFFAWWVAKTMGPGKWGFVTLMITTINVFTILCLVGMDVSLIKYTSQNTAFKSMGILRGLIRKMLGMLAMIVVAVVVMGFLFPDFFAKILYGSESFRPWFIVVLFGIPGNVFYQFNSAALAGAKDMISYGIYKNMLLFGVALIVYALGYYTIFPIFLERFLEGGILILACYVGAIYLGLFFSSIQVWKKLKFSEKTHSHTLRKSAILKESLPMLFAAAMSIIISTTDYFMLSHFESQVSVGLYDIAVKISLLTAVVLLAVNAIATPKFSEFFSKNDFVSLRRIVSQSSKLIFWCSFPILGLILCFPNFFLGLFGEDFKLAAPALIFLSIGQFIASITGSVGNLLKMTENQKILQNLSLIAVVLNVVLNFLLIPIYSITGAALASCVSISFLNLASSFYAYRQLNIRTIYLPFFSK